MQISFNIEINITILCRHLTTDFWLSHFQFYIFSSNHCSTTKNRYSICILDWPQNTIYTMFTSNFKGSFLDIIFPVNTFFILCYNTWINHFHNLNVSLKNFLHFMCKLKMQPGTLTFCQNLFTVLSGRQRGITLHFNGYKPFTIKF